ncbi:MAG: hypothetical protein ABFS38_09970 [Bacteroidota bacterium]
MILFNLEFHLQGYPDDINQYIKIIPDIETRDLIPEYRILRRKQKNADVSLILVEPEGPQEDRPEISLRENEIFRFVVKIADKSFLNRTHLATYDLEANIISLSNEVNHVAGSEILLSRSINSYQNTDDYEPGYLVESGGNHFRALQASNSGDPHPVSDTSFWASIPDGTFVSQADLQPRSSAVDLNGLMMIEIKHSSTLPSAYRLLDVSSKCKEINYKIKLLS